jgi:hypothetical protein
VARSRRTEWLQGCLLLAWALAIVPNAVDAFGGPQAGWWHALRLGLAAAFVLVLVAFATSRLADWLRL